jgi:hypothetical protein
MIVGYLTTRKRGYDNFPVVSIASDYYVAVEVLGIMISRFSVP